jgi:hypothetical protein
LAVAHVLAVGCKGPIHRFRSEHGICILREKALDSPGPGDWPGLDALGEDKWLLAPFICKLLVREILEAINLVGCWDVLGVVAQRDMAADKRAV